MVVNCEAALHAEQGVVVRRYIYSGYRRSYKYNLLFVRQQCLSYVICLGGGRSERLDKTRLDAIATARLAVTWSVGLNVKTSPRQQRGVARAHCWPEAKLLVSLTLQVRLRERRCGLDDDRRISALCCESLT